MSYQLSVLDKCPVSEGDSATEALENMLNLARAAEQWGYKRFWLAEHHNTSSLASPSPEILIAWVIAHTRKIHVGSGGVMLQHYSPYKVAENFNLLASLAPGRVDLGIGKAPGGLPLSTRALQSGRDPAQQGSFSEQLALLDRYLHTRDSAGQQDSLLATPIAESPPRQFLLGASTDSAQLAAELGWNFVFAAHLNGDRNLLRKFSDYWQQHTRRPVIVAVQAIVSEQPEHAIRQAEELQLWQVTLENGQHVTVGSEAQAESYIRQSEVAVKSVSRKETAILAGSAAEVVAQLNALHREFSVNEFIIDVPLSQPQARQETLRLLAEAALNRSSVQDPVVTDVSVS